MFTEINHSLFRWINDAHNPVGDVFFGVVSGFGDGLIIALLCTVLMLYRFRAGLAFLLAFAGSGLFTQMLKRIFDTPRPPVVLDQVHILGDTLTRHSFPSGHATSDGVLLVAGFFLWSFRDVRAWGIAVLFFLAAIGRIYGGVHFPFDVMVGLIIGGAWSWLCWTWVHKWPEMPWMSSHWVHKVPTLAIAVQAVILGLGYRIQPVTAGFLAMLVSVGALIAVVMYWKHHGVADDGV